MPKVTRYLDCGCAILEGGARVWCPSYESTEPTVSPPALLKALDKIADLEAANDRLVRRLRRLEDKVEREVDRGNQS